MLHHPAKVEADACPEAKPYLEGVGKHHEQEAQQLATLTGGDIGAIRKKLSLPPAPPQRPWWGGLWK
ncbi:MAG: hypothetical protein JNK92_06830 [Dechloromonas sp.]|nr:hypothetical protein [Dechloromonas sp.]